MNDTYYFLSDVHLGLEDAQSEKAKEKILTDALRMVKQDAKELFIVGDLFDYWFEYRRVYQKGFFRTLSALQDLTDAGIIVHYLIGNHDFMHDSFFESTLNIRLYEGNIEHKIGDKKFFISHGDGLIKDDYLYNILKKILRNKTVQFLYSLIHPDLGISIASHSSKKSREGGAKYEYDTRDKLFDVAKEKIDSGFDYVIMGHIHKRVSEDYKQGHYYNLGTWLKAPCLGKYKDDKFEFMELEKYKNV